MRMQDELDRNRNPPGMWAGFYAILPDCVAFRPRMGMDRGMELTVRDNATYPSQKAAVAAGRAAAWERYDEWQREGPEKTMGEHLRDQALAEMERREAEEDATLTP